MTATAASRPRRTRGVALRGAVALVVGVLAGCVTDPTPVPPVSSSTIPAPTTSSSSLPVGASEHAVTIDGRIRMYRAYRPPDVLEPVPLVVMLHGGLGNARAAEAAYGWDVLAQTQGFIVLYPDAVANAWNAGGGCCGLAPGQGVDDVGFVKRAIDEVRQSAPIDPKRIYVTGMSNGGMMAYRMACESDLFAAIGPVAATLLGDCTNPAPTSVIHIHGTDDTTIPYAGGVDTGVAHVDGPAVPALIARWRTTDRCGGEVISTAGLVTRSLARCPSGRDVLLVTVEGGGHAWPGVARSGPLDSHPSATTTPAPAPTPTPTPDGAAPSPHASQSGDALNATWEIWAFFKAHAR
ncbi:MAG: PHB depolymerase family esterase [Dermatophilaceae bacterium]